MRHSHGGTREGLYEETSLPGRRLTGCESRGPWQVPLRCFQFLPGVRRALLQRLRTAVARSPALHPLPRDRSDPNRDAKTLAVTRQPHIGFGVTD